MAETREELSERRRVSIPKVDTTTREWWALQHDVGLSLRLLIRAEVERNGYKDVAFGRVTQLPRRGRPSNDDVQDAEANASTEQSERDTTPATETVTGDVDSEREILVGPARSGRSVPRDDSPSSASEPDPIASLMGLGV